MAQDNNNSTPAPATTKKEDLVSKIGTLTYGRAVENFGKDRALAVMHKVAEIGGHGMFEDAHFVSPLFGGLAMPAPGSVIKPDKKDFANLPDADFRYQLALDDYAVLQEQATANRAAINDLYISLK